MARAALAALIAAGAVLALVLLPGGRAPEPTRVAVSIPSPESRPPDLAPGIKWMPESPRYRYARRLVFERGLDFQARLDLSTTRLSRNKHYRITIRDRVEPVSLHQFQHWSLFVATALGDPVDGAIIDVAGGMPRHGHGLPTRPRAIPGEGPGQYRIEGLQFSMPGWWELHVYVSKDRRDDIVTFNVILE